MATRYAVIEGQGLHDGGETVRPVYVTSDRAAAIACAARWQGTWLSRSTSGGYVVVEGEGPWLGHEADRLPRISVAGTDEEGREMASAIKVRAYASVARDLAARHLAHNSTDVAYAQAGTLRVDTLLAAIEADVERHGGHVHVAECATCDDHDVIEVCNSRECYEREGEKGVIAVRVASR